MAGRVCDQGGRRSVTCNPPPGAPRSIDRTRTHSSLPKFLSFNFSKLELLAKVSEPNLPEAAFPVLDIVSAGGWYRFANTHPHSGNCVNCGNCRTNEFPHIPQFLLVKGLRKDADRMRSGPSGTGTANGQTTKNQECESVAERHGWRVATVYKDQGISGAKGRDKRPVLDRLMQAVARKEVDMIAAWSVDRLGRSLTDLVQLQVHHAK